MPQVHIVAYCGDLGYGVARGAEMLSLMLGFGIISRLASGYILDKIGGLSTLLLGSFLASAAAAAPAAAQAAFPNLRLIAPAAPGGGWDQTARVIQQVLLSTGLARTVSVENVPGAAGTIGLARFVSAERGNGDTLMASGLIMLGAITGTPAGQPPALAEVEAAGTLIP